MERFVEVINGYKTITYKQDNLLHNSSGPAIYTYFSTGELKSISYYSNGLIYRQNDLPNYAQFYRSGTYFLKEWHNTKNQLHRLTGPAKIMYYEDPNYNPWKNYYLNGIPFPHWLPIIEYGKTKEELTKKIIVRSIFFNMEYGLLLKQIHDNLSKR